MPNRSNAGELTDGAKYRLLREKARLRQAAKRQKRKEAGEILVQAYTTRRFAEEARAEGYSPVVVWTKEKLPDTLVFIRSDTNGYIFRLAVRKT